MGFKDKLMNKFLERSNSFNYYKENFLKLKKSNEKYRKEIGLLKQDLKDKDSELKLLRKEFLLNQIQLNDSDGEFIFSIIMAVYNTEKFLTEAIESIINQTFPFEKVQLILVDDGSNDGSDEICKVFADKYPENIIYLYQENSGQAAARNNGLEYASGKFLNFLDSDDKLELNVLEEVYLNFVKFGDEIDIISIPRYLFGVTEGPMYLNYKYNENRIVDIFREYDFPITSISASFVRRNALSEKFNTQVIISEDSLLLNKTLLKKCKFGVVGSCNYFYRKRSEQNSTIDTKKIQKEYFNIRMELYFKELINESLEIYGEVLKYIQNVLMYDLRWLFEQNTEIGVLNKDESEEFYNHIYDVLQYVDDDIILSSKLNNFLKYNALEFKYDKSHFDFISIDDDLLINWGGEFFDKLSNYKFIITDLSLEGNNLFLKGFFNFYSFEDCTIELYDKRDKLDLICKKEDKFYSIGREVSSKSFYELKTILPHEYNELHFQFVHDLKKYRILIGEYLKVLENVKVNDNEIIIDLT